MVFFIKKGRGIMVHNHNVKHHKHGKVTGYGVDMKAVHQTLEKTMKPLDRMSQSQEYSRVKPKAKKYISLNL
jgi:hypothetical protein